MGVIGTLRSWSDICGAEGAAAVRDRLLDRWSEARAWRRLSSHADESWPAVSILNVIGVEAAARGGGVPLQLRARLARERAGRPVALLSRHRGGFRLGCWSGGRPCGTFFPCAGWNGDPLRDEPGWLDVVLTAARLVGARAVHVENLAGLSLSSLAQLARSELPLVVSVHDFTAFCRRPHLWESSGIFCDYSTDARRCHGCLTAAAEPLAIDQSRHRSLAAQILSGASALIFPSSFLRTRLSALTPWGSRPACEIVPPGVEYPDGEPRSTRDEHEVAFIGGGADHKGGGRLSRLARGIVARGASVTVYGGNGHHNLRQLRRISNVRVRGYFRAGSLPALLARQRASVALLLPEVPETFSLVLSDAWAAGVPVVAPARGALGERLHDGGGRLLAESPSDDEVLSALDDLRRLPAVPIPAPPTAAAAALRHLELYRRWGFSSER